MRASFTIILACYFFCLVSSEITTFTNFVKKDSNTNVTAEKGTRVFYVHDWNTKDLAKAYSIKDAILKSRKDVTSVVICDWTTFSRIPNYHNVAKKYTSRVAGEIWGQAQSSKDKIECIGHGLGAHICGQVGKLAKKNEREIAKITALDPTGPYFKDHRSEGLQKGDANIVQAIHTDKRYGIYQEIGDEDSFPEDMEECEKSRLLKKNLCLHNSALEVYLNKISGAEGRSRRAKYSMSILTLDVSPSMQNYGRIQNTITASKRLINSLPEGYSLGIVIFGSHAVTSLLPTNITSESRALITSKLPLITTQIANTSIGAGVSKAIDVLMPYLDMEGYCPDIILVTDGEENWSPFIRDIQPRLNQATTNMCSRVHTIALGAEADTGLEALSKSTGGQAHFSGDVGSADKLTQSLIAASSAQFGMKERKPIQLPAKEVQVNSSATFAIDEGVGANTSFFISTPNPETLTAELIAPNGEVYGNATYSTEADLQGLLFKLLEVQPGNWTIKLNSRDTGRRRRRDIARTPKRATVFVTTYPSQDSDGHAILLEAYLSTKILDAKTDKMFVEAFLMRGDEPILGADVYALITSSTGKIERVQLLDNGIGADEEKDDGVYRRYIQTKLEPGARYGVEVVATSNPNGPTYLGTLSDDPFEPNSPDTWRPLKYHFERQASAGSFRVAPNFQQRVQTPSPITDLNVRDVDLENRTCTLEWTNPEEPVSSIELRAFTIDDIGITLTNNHIVEGSLHPGKPSSRQFVKVKVPQKLRGDNTTIELDELYFTVRSASSSGGLSEVSNLAPVELSIEEPVQSAGLDSSIVILIILLSLLIALALIGLTIFLLRRRKSAQFRVRHPNSQKL